MARNNSGVKSATGLTGSGSRDWILQRISAVVLAVYAVVVIGFFLFNQVDYNAWHGFMMSLPMKLFSLVAILSLVFHAWVGMWTVFTDYVKSSGLRIVLQAAVIVAVLVYLFWGVMIFW
ncbi:succinate dehydrogenase [Moraxella bovoculi]|uniref:Succinate dehydrogenase hydrophobic membrane anchor subunit n=1 Tax=Moraxella bovoculi 237 TaxID=743974 RepID=A0A066UDM1_9GAMM|nr:succinate dehydrogenase, hydrophobic membrane anchor protein [Moraxella bovoculi]AKG14700.1 succinate dehydrogenase [Moraxella bovoculi]AKG16369.1 succinate dehydrogenase, hydrophobic membrane anchor protein [Moraxella bovoculi]AKG18110.1 succinate dehydrogenase [Moraxella bovoculi]KDN25511.1 succinate dehydrogenase hydrophobic membrane anchor subunit [Moraxella bovoculi 237]NSM11214.1 succinate dehydrogenase, hydrophobic membrane anchor protein [Moraxella bovoculi]